MLQWDGEVFKGLREAAGGRAVVKINFDEHIFWSIRGNDGMNIIFIALLVNGQIGKKYIVSRNKIHHVQPQATAADKSLMNIIDAGGGFLCYFFSCSHQLLSAAAFFLQ